MRLTGRMTTGALRVGQIAGFARIQRTSLSIAIASGILPTSATVSLARHFSRIKNPSCREAGWAGWVSEQTLSEILASGVPAIGVGGSRLLSRGCQGARRLRIVRARTHDRHRRGPRGWIQQLRSSAGARLHIGHWRHRQLEAGLIAALQGRCRSASYRGGSHGLLSRIAGWGIGCRRSRARWDVVSRRRRAGRRIIGG